MLVILNVSLFWQGFSVNYGHTLRAHDPDVEYLIGADNMFYMFKKLQEYHKCYGKYYQLLTHFGILKSHGAKNKQLTHIIQENLY